MKAKGSGYFGQWINGKEGVPAYLYECDQIHDQKALTMTGECWNDRRNHIFAFGNDRICAVASNLGYVKLRQDEGCPKFLTDYNPKSLQFGGGFGYLLGEDILCTFYDGEPMRREFGAGYILKRKENREAAVEEVLFAPYGDDPVIIKTVSITNLSVKEKPFRWFDYWAGDMYQFTFIHFILAQLTLNTANTSRFRRRFDRGFTKNMDIIPGGASVTRQYRGSGLLLAAGQNALQGVFRRAGKRFITDKEFAGAGADYRPPKVGVFLLSGEPSAVHTNARSFFGKGGVAAPDMPGGKEVKTNTCINMLMLETEFTLSPGEKHAFAIAYTYETDNCSIADMQAKYRGADAQALLAGTLERWKKDRVAADLPGDEWADRELMWHNSYLRGNMTYSDYFGAHILSQGGVYQYLMGLQGAPRDQLQHSLSFIYTEPAIAREHILFTLREMSPEGELPYLMQGGGLPFAPGTAPSDLQLMLLNFVSEYILATRDFAFLGTEYTSKLSGNKLKRTVLEGVLTAYRYAKEVIGCGGYDLMRIGSGDWNDQVISARVPFYLAGCARKHGVSVLNSAIAAYSFRMFGEMLAAAGELREAENSFEIAENIRKAVKGQWTGKWFRRAYLGKKIGWLGEDLLWLEPQGWALVSGCCDGEQARILAENIRLELSNPNGCSLISRSTGKKEDSAGLDPGVLENGGIWPAMNSYLIWGLSKVNGEWAYEEWLKNSRTAQAEAFPEVWYGIWSGPDAMSAGYARFPGRTQNNRNPITGKRIRFFRQTPGINWEDFPVLNLHAHTWQQYTVFKLLGLEFTAKGISFAPVIPKERYKITSPLVDFEKDGNVYILSYRPLMPAALELKFSAGGSTQTQTAKAPFEKLAIHVRPDS